MKNIFALATLLTGFSLSPLHADSLVAQVQGVDRDIASVQLLDSGLVTVTRSDNSQGSLQLAKSNAQELLALAQILANAELVHEHHPIVCMIALDRFTLQELYVADASGQLRLTLSAQTCALPDKTYPKESFQMGYAEQIKSQLLVLAHQIVNN